MLPDGHLFSVDTRFARSWRQADERRRQGESFDRVIDSMSSAELIEAVAGAASEDAVAAHTMATAVLDRVHRSRLFGALLGIGLVSLVAGILVVAIDLALTGTLGVLETRPAGLDLAAVGVAGIVVSLLVLLAAFRMRRQARLVP